MSCASVNKEIRLTPFQQALSSCCGAIITSFVVTPLDVVKTRMQVQQKNFKTQNKCFLYCNGLMDHICSCGPLSNEKWFKNNGQVTSTKDAFLKIIRTEGVSALWSGLSPTLVLAVPATIVYFVTYEQLKYNFKDSYVKHYNNQQSIDKLPWFIPVCAGGCARLLATTFVNPLELIRTKMQSQKMNYFEINEALKLLIKSNGIGGLWRGIVPTLLRDVPFSSIYWVGYETMKSLFNHQQQPSPGVSFVSGMAAGAIAASLTTPFDVVKTYQQIEFGEKLLYSDNSKQQQENTAKKPPPPPPPPTTTTTTLKRFKMIYHEHGIQGLFRGIVPRVVKVAPACAIMITTFEYGKKFFHNLTINEKHDKKSVNSNDNKQNEDRIVHIPNSKDKEIL